MACAESKQETAYTLEVYVEAVFGLRAALGAAAVSFVLGDFQPLVVMAPNGAAAVSSGDDLVFSRGKSSLFAMAPDELRRVLRASPLVVLLLDVADPSKPLLCAAASIDLRQPLDAPLATHGLVRGMYYMYDPVGNEIAKIGLAVRLLDRGPQLLAHLARVAATRPTPPPPEPVADDAAVAPDLAEETEATSRERSPSPPPLPDTFCPPALFFENDGSEPASAPALAPAAAENSASAANLQTSVRTKVRVRRVRRNRSPEPVPQPRTDPLRLSALGSRPGVVDALLSELGELKAAAAASRRAEHMDRTLRATLRTEEPSEPRLTRSEVLRRSAIAQRKRDAARTAAREQRLFRAFANPRPLPNSPPVRPQPSPDLQASPPATPLAHSMSGATSPTGMPSPANDPELRAELDELISDLEASLSSADDRAKAGTSLPVPVDAVSPSPTYAIDDFDSPSTSSTSSPASALSSSSSSNSPYVPRAPLSIDLL
ncbi:uncharacterized protein AMSG_01297 [Thecamonas trahens ATCC 50062]|uniref:Uncharacterized protein n=1 Tax=Thecamonas trahens ATCC 50062 TaxID=461836 RepID=A0A0L0DMR4_THETB|nr:hypothetical protein AMSG_01297 [Thecamonas trahens ATCC 50062]KNC53587.1 hypothetical protein AMSG_01297 [Thecamonas trahens ATCC 50062]|eukprot:XP_013761904.1 hypothetical protein AMSG_01297 [Thecamonas trahens ATCC 50062]